MVEIKLHNTKTRQKEVFTPINPENVRMYVCGPTVYDRAHLGNARPVIVFDVLQRLLRLVYGAEQVTYVRNFTDVDDKINARAAETDRSIGDICDETIGWFLDDMRAVGAADPDKMPRATEFIPQMITMIEGLIESGHAYAAEGHVLFAVESYKNYGALSGRSIDDMIAGARVEVAPYKRNPMDFVLWKPSDAKTPGWESPWGYGRPGWHIECSAMAYELLGASFDIHGGGNDLMFPHHENEVAQSCCAHPEGEFANVWLHNEMLQVEGKKMSKSLGNFFTVRDLLDQGVAGEVIRFVMLSTHYRKPMDWTEKKRSEAETTLRKWRALTAGIDPAANAAPEAIAALADDLNTAGAITVMHKLASEGAAAELLATGALLGLLGDDLAWGQADLSSFEVMLTDARAKAMETKDFSEVDRLKTALLDAGVEVQMSREGVKLAVGAGFDAAKLEALQ
ncbi:cysteine--tRNA ligase [Falsihalocynthiibacter sp. SS001]|uniref:cysteine--tRNA ligase n=1 Tax=Falsihalocynthiibacter sp. SS001 TaxID=3349698 RepID=UPI0036D32333